MFSGGGGEGDSKWQNLFYLNAGNQWSIIHGGMCAVHGPQGGAHCALTHRAPMDEPKPRMSLSDSFTPSALISGPQKESHLKGCRGCSLAHFCYNSIRAEGGAGTGEDTLT